MSASHSGRDAAVAGFDFSTAMARLCEDIAYRLPALQHIQMDQVAVAFAQTRRRVSYGLQAKLTPMRFERGSLFTRQHGQTWTVQRMFREGREILYILTFYLPRFLNHPFREKLVTVFHELFHISPLFDGDIRRLEGHYHVHSHSQKEYDRQMGFLVDEYMALSPPRDLYRFLESRFNTLQSRHGAVTGLQVRVPKLIPVRDQKIA